MTSASLFHTSTSATISHSTARLAAVVEAGTAAPLKASSVPAATDAVANPNAHSSSQASSLAGHRVAATAAPAASAGPQSQVAEQGSPALAPLPDHKPELVDKFLSAEVFPTAARRRHERRGVLRDFQRHPADTGSPQVMVAMWTHRVRELVRNFDANRKSLHPMRHLEMMVNRRRRMLTWLRQHDFDAYSYTIAKLGLRDIYTPLGISDRYREGLRHSDPVADDSVNRLRFSLHRKYRQKKTSLWRRLRPKLVAEDPALEALDSATAAATKQRRQQQLAAQAQAVQQ